VERERREVGKYNTPMLQRIADLLTKEHAVLWINHDKAQRDTLKMSPEYYE
jgi:N-acyl homoserine lactone hydrolase